MTPEQLEASTIIRVDIGSRGFGLNTQASDHDHKAVCVEGFSTHMTVGMKRWEQDGPHKYGTDIITAYPEGLDIETYSLWKFNHLAMGGNPNILCILFHPKPIFINEAGKALKALTPYLLSRRAGHAFLGYMQAQRQKLLTGGRPKWVDIYGFDVKFAMHLLRIGLQGIELLTTGNITLPVPEADRTYLMAVREGRIPLEACVARALDLETQLKSLVETSTVLPEKPDRDYVELWTRSAYWDMWKVDTERDLLKDMMRVGFADFTIH